MIVLEARAATIRLTCVAFSPDGALVAACGDRGEARAWDVASRRAVAGPPQYWPAVAVFFGPGGRELFVLNEYTRGLTAYRIGEPASRLLGHMDLVTAAPGGDGAFVYTRAEPGTVALHTLDPFAAVWQSSLAGVTCLGCSPDGTVLACGHAGGAVTLLDAGTGAKLGRHVGRSAVKAVAVAPGGKGVAWCGAANLRFRRLPGGPRAHHRLGRTHFLGAAWHPSGAFFATANGDGKVDTWDALTGERRGSFDWGVGKLNAVAFDAGGDRAACCSDTGKVVVWDVDR